MSDSSDPGDLRDLRGLRDPTGEPSGSMGGQVRWLPRAHAVGFHVLAWQISRPCGWPKAGSDAPTLTVLATPIAKHQRALELIQ
ncbi:hypothetical protein Bpro_1411 [Polaromonas sp. JS666]|nr:hypothetical protein Bpro_1411 [Polaromonas sp. JS666]